MVMRRDWCFLVPSPDNNRSPTLVFKCTCTHSSLGACSSDFSSLQKSFTFIRLIRGLQVREAGHYRVLLLILEYFKAL